MHGTTEIIRILEYQSSLCLHGLLVPPNFWIDLLRKGLRSVLTHIENQQIKDILTFYILLNREIVKLSRHHTPALSKFPQ